MVRSCSASRVGGASQDGNLVALVFFAAAEHTHRDYVNGVGAVVARMDDAQVCGWATTTALSVRSGSEVNETVNLLS
jgi:hypothetical protein